LPSGACGASIACLLRRHRISSGVVAAAKCQILKPRSFKLGVLAVLPEEQAVAARQML
jgi:hypothetical protein